MSIDAVGGNGVTGSWGTCCIDETYVVIACLASQSIPAIFTAITCAVVAGQSQFLPRFCTLEDTKLFNSVRAKDFVVFSRYVRVRMCIDRGVRDKHADWRVFGAPVCLSGSATTVLIQRTFLAVHQW